MDVLDCWLVLGNEIVLKVLYGEGALREGRNFSFLFFLF